MFAITINNNYNKKIEADILAIKGEVMNKEIINQTFMVIDYAEDTIIFLLLRMQITNWEYVKDFTRVVKN